MKKENFTPITTMPTDTEAKYLAIGHYGNPFNEFALPADLIELGGKLDFITRDKGFAITGWQELPIKMEAGA